MMNNGVLESITMSEKVPTAMKKTPRAKAYFDFIRSHTHPKKSLLKALNRPIPPKAVAALVTGIPISWRCGTWLRIVPTRAN